MGPKDEQLIKQEIRRLRKRQNSHVRDMRLERHRKRLKRLMRKKKRATSVEES